MARTDLQADEGGSVRPRSGVKSTATQEEVNAALDAAAADLGIDPNIPDKAAADYFAPIGGGGTPGNASVADMTYFTDKGFTPGPLPAEYQSIYGNDPSVMGWKLETNADGTQGISVVKEQGDADNGLQFQTYGASFTKDSKGNVVPATPTSTGKPTVGNVAGTASLTTSPLSTTASDTAKAGRTSAYNTLYDEFNKYGLGNLVSDIKNYLIDNTFDPSEFSIQLQNTQAYQDRFKANKDRIAKGLTALRPADYIRLEDQYQNIMRNYGLPDSYWTKGTNGVQPGFDQLIANDVDSTELENRLITAQQRVINADPNVLDRLKIFYPDIKNGDILAYTLDPKNALDMIKRKVTAAEIGGAQLGAGLASDVASAEALGAAGVTGAQYAQAAPFISQAAQRGSQLSDIYGQAPYNQASAEAEALNTSGGAQAAAKRKKLTALETAAFSGSSGVGSLGRDKSLYGAMQGQSGLY